MDMSEMRNGRDVATSRKNDMEKIKINYVQDRADSIGSQNDWDRYEFVYFASNPEISCGKKFAKIVITLQICKNTKVRLNGLFTLMWYTICDEYGNKLKTPNLSWSFSDVFHIPSGVNFYDIVNDKNIANLIEEMTDTALHHRITLRQPLQNSINEVLGSVNAMQESQSL